MIKLVIFDLDGTLLYTLEDLADSCNYLLRKHQLPEHPLDSFRYFVGNGIKKLVERALPEEKRSEAFVESFFQEMIAYYGLHKEDKTRPYPQIVETLEALQDDDSLFQMVAEWLDFALMVQQAFMERQGINAGSNSGNTGGGTGTTAAGSSAGIDTSKEKWSLSKDESYLTAKAALTKQFNDGEINTKEELDEQLKFLEGNNKLLEAQRLKQRTNYDLEMIQEIGYCSGIENYSRYLTGRAPGEPPPTLFESALDKFPFSNKVFLPVSLTLPEAAKDE